MHCHLTELGACDNDIGTAVDNALDHLHENTRNNAIQHCAAAIDGGRCQLEVGRHKGMFFNEGLELEADYCFWVVAYTHCN